MAAPRLNVLISGAGIAGPCLAYWLTKTGLDVSVTIVERSATPRVTGQAIDVRGRAIEVMQKMHLEEALRSRNTTEEGTVFVDSSGKAFAHYQGGDAFTAEYEILRADLSEIFLEVTQDLSNVKYIYNDSIQSLGQTDTAVNVTFNSGKEDTFDLVVAADGSTSKTRPLILDEEILKNSYRPLGQYMAFFSVPRVENDSKLWKWYNTVKGLSLMLRPHRNPSTMGAYLCMTMPARGDRDATVEDAMSKGTEETKRVLRAYFEDAGWEAKRILDGMDQSEDFYMARSAQVKLSKWTNGRALVLGDAAFATFGTGTSLAIESAYVLAGELSKIQSNDQVPQAVAKYEEVFRPHYHKLGDIPWFFPQLVFPQSGWGLWLRDALLWLLSVTRLYKLLPVAEGIGLPLPSYEWVGI